MFVVLFCVLCCVCVSCVCCMGVCVLLLCLVFCKIFSERVCVLLALVNVFCVC